MTFQYCFDGSIKKVNNLSVSSPRTWGCFPKYRPASWNPPSLPHARGGVSLGADLLKIPRRSSPRTWGCFYRPIYQDLKLKVFPTHVGVFLTTFQLESFKAGLPHARGGVSEDGDGGWRRLSSSPRTWGCFRGIVPCRISLWVFPTHVGVFLASKYAIVFDRGLPHARGGVSSSVLSALSFTTSSPRTWGCFHAGHGHETQAGVFPTHVGVFLKRRIRSAFGLCLPYARGVFQKNY